MGQQSGPTRNAPHASARRRAGTKKQHPRAEQSKPAPLRKAFCPPFHDIAINTPPMHRNRNFSGPAKSTPHASSRRRAGTKREKKKKVPSFAGPRIASRRNPGMAKCYLSTVIIIRRRPVPSTGIIIRRDPAPSTAGNLGWPSPNDTSAQSGMQS